MTIADLQSITCYQGWMLASDQRHPQPLTRREREILDSVLAGLTHKEIAFELGVSDTTVRVLYSRAMKKLGRAKSRGG
jgi:DNA-binding NarL/FixJ family response regulator